MLQLSPSCTALQALVASWLWCYFGAWEDHLGGHHNSETSLTMVGETGWTLDHLNLPSPLLALHHSRLQDPQPFHIQTTLWTFPHASSAQPIPLHPAQWRRATNSSGLLCLQLIQNPAAEVLPLPPPLPFSLHPHHLRMQELQNILHQPCPNHSTRRRIFVGDFAPYMTCFCFLTLGHFWGAVDTAGGAPKNNHPLFYLHETSMKSVYTYEIHIFVKRWRTIASSLRASPRKDLASAAS